MVLGTGLTTAQFFNMKIQMFYFMLKFNPSACSAALVKSDSL